MDCREKRWWLFVGFWMYGGRLEVQRRIGHVFGCLKWCWLWNGLSEKVTAMVVEMVMGQRGKLMVDEWIGELLAMNFLKKQKVIEPVNFD
jgi:hypothetical protein